MPLPVIIAIGAAVAGAAGVMAGVNGASKMKEAGDEKERIIKRDKRNNSKLKEKIGDVQGKLDDLGRKQLEILESFGKFADVVSKIQNRPAFGEMYVGGGSIESPELKELKKESELATFMLGSATGAAAGTLGGMAAAGGTTTAVMALGTASTGTAISTLSGAAATNATLAAIGGGSIAAGGGGVALGTAILTGATLGVGLLFGGIIFNMTGSHMEEKVEELRKNMEKNERIINKTCNFLDELKNAYMDYIVVFNKLIVIYRKNFRIMKNAVESGCTDFREFTPSEQRATHICALSVGILRGMMKLKLVSDFKKEEVNRELKTQLKYVPDSEGKILEGAGLPQGI